MSRPEVALVAHRVRREAWLLPWTPAFIAGAYLLLFAVRFPRLIERVYWDSDVATAGVIPETAGRGTIVLERFGWFTSLWFALLTKPLPFHRQLWEVAPYLFALGGVALLGWASWRLAGSWAAAMTATAALAVCPFVSYARVTLNFHSATPVATAVLAVFAFWITQNPRREYASAAAVLVAMLAGATLASDHLFAFVGVLPLALTGALLLFVLRERVQGAIVLVAAASAVPLALAVSRLMTASKITVSSAARERFTEENNLWPNFGRYLKSLVQLANGDYFLGARLDARSSLSLACALLALLALAAPFELVRREVRSPSPNRSLLVYSSFWATCLAFNAASFVLSEEGEHTGYYLIPTLFGLAATVPLVLSASVARRTVAALGIALVATASLVNLADTKTALAGGSPPIASVADRIVQIAKEENAPIGYADYWDAASLTWSKDFAVRVYPVTRCVQNSDALCPFWFNLVSSWYEPRRSKSFVLRDSAAIDVSGDPPKSFGRPSATHLIYAGDVLFTIFVYPYDVASRLDFSNATW